MEIGFQAVYNENGYEQLLEQLSAKSSEKQAGETAQAQ